MTHSLQDAREALTRGDFATGRLHLLALAREGRADEALAIIPDFAGEAGMRGRLFALFAQLLEGDARRDAPTFLTHALRCADLTANDLFDVLEDAARRSEPDALRIVADEAALSLLADMLRMDGENVRALLTKTRGGEGAFLRIVARSVADRAPLAKALEGWLTIHAICAAFRADDAFLRASALADPMDLDLRMMRAMTALDAGALAEAEQEFCAFVARYCERPRRLRLSYIPPRTLDDGAGAEALAETLAAARHVGVSLFPMGGTLLGLWRDGRLIDGDVDLDFGLLGPSDAQTLLSSPHFMSLFREPPVFARAPHERWVTTLLHRNGVFVDLFQFREIDGRLVAGCDNAGQDWLWEWTPFRLRDGELAGHACALPDDVERFHAEHYGPDWRRPDPHYYVPHNLCAQSRDIMVVLALRQIGLSLIEMKIEKACALARDVERLRPACAGLSATIERLLASGRAAA